MRRRAVVSCIAILALGACSDGPSDPPDDDPQQVTDAVAVVVAPRALLLAEAGATQQLQAYAIDATGDSTPVAATFESSNPSIVSVSGTGLAVAGSGIGSTVIVARAGGLTSTPVLGATARPTDGALLVTDAQVIG
ncbi:MAG: Ig-like domain-containing protein, partial [Gemmatimonadales bacterium]